MAQPWRIHLQLKRQRRQIFDFQARMIPWRRKGQHIPVFFLDNPMDTGARWATIHNFKKESDRTKLKQQFYKRVLQSNSVHSLSHVGLFSTPWITAHQSSLPMANSWSLLKLMSIESVMLSNHLILSSSFPPASQSLPALGSSPMSQIFIWDGQSIGVSASASVISMNIQDWSPLTCTG